jgi:hypothetical protein
MAPPAMSDTQLGSRLVAAWREAGEDLGIAVVAPVELRDAAGEAFLCEAFVRDFGSASGAVVMTSRTERRVRQQLRSLVSGLWYSLAPDERYVRKHFIDMLVDWGWCGDPDRKPAWYVGSRAAGVP